MPKASERLRELDKARRPEWGFQHADHELWALLPLIADVVEAAEAEVAACGYSPDHENCLVCTLHRALTALRDALENDHA